MGKTRRQQASQTRLWASVHRAQNSTVIYSLSACKCARERERSLPLLLPSAASNLQEETTWWVYPCVPRVTSREAHLVVDDVEEEEEEEGEGRGGRRKRRWGRKRKRHRGSSPLFVRQVGALSPAEDRASGPVLHHRAPLSPLCLQRRQTDRQTDR